MGKRKLQPNVRGLSQSPVTFTPLLSIHRAAATRATVQKECFMEKLLTMQLIYQLYQSMRFYNKIEYICSLKSLI